MPGSLAPLSWLLVLLCAGTGVGGMYLLCRWRGWLTPNWEGRAIPAGVGLGFVPALWAATALSLPLAMASPAWQLLVVVTGFGILGFIDDRWGSREISGLRGHVGALLTGRVTTGAIKLLGGIALSLWGGFQLYADQPVRALLAGGVVALSANTLNLLDCRPSRAVKAAWVYALATLALGLYQPLLAGLLLATVVYAPLDFRCQAMMGDAGANVLGAALGVCWAREGSLPAQLALAFLLLGGHVVAERVSLTQVIERHSLLRWLDQLGVRRAGSNG